MILDVNLGGIFISCGPKVLRLCSYVLCLNRTRLLGSFVHFSAIRRPTRRKLPRLLDNLRLTRRWPRQPESATTRDSQDPGASAAFSEYSRGMRPLCLLVMSFSRLMIRYPCLRIRMRQGCCGSGGRFPCKADGRFLPVSIIVREWRKMEGRR